MSDNYKCRNVTECQINTTLMRKQNQVKYSLYCHIQ